MRGNTLYLTVCERGRENASDGGNERGESLGKWWYGDLAGESVSHCLSGLSLRDQMSLIEKEILLKEYQIKCMQVLVQYYVLCDKT